MRRSSFEDMNCSIAQSLEVIGEWWTPLIVRDLLMGVSHFDELQRRLGVARNVLTARLNHLVDAGVVEKVPYQSSPVRYDYRLTDKGRELWVVNNALREWGDRWSASNGAPVELVHESCGNVVQVVPTCSCCGEELEPSKLRLIDGPGAGAQSVLPRRQG